MTTAILHEVDRFAWLEERTRLLGSGNLGDWESLHPIEELESERGAERRELYRRLRVLLAHLLKWQFQPAGRCNRWKATVRIQRNAIARLFKETPQPAPFPDRRIGRGLSRIRGMGSR
jgi:hypothetical protein